MTNRLLELQKEARHFVAYVLADEKANPDDINALTERIFIAAIEDAKSVMPTPTDGLSILYHRRAIQNLEALTKDV